MPPGPAFALLESPNAKWPTAAGRKAGFHLHGYALDEKRRPTFRYSFQDLEIEDAPVPIAGEVDPFFRRRVTVHANGEAQNLWFRAWLGEKIEEQGGGVFLADGKVKLRFEIAGGGKALLRRSEGRSELLIPVQFNGKEAQFVEEIIW